MHRFVFHIDVNSAFLSWSALKLLQEDPNAVDLRTIPSAVCGDRESRHGVIVARSTEAKKYGVNSPEPVVSALRKCPSLDGRTPGTVNRRSPAARTSWC